ncbi:hypothetical protein D8674_031235 [Pyrus ussuriensis x Pyrus communis]|uniref:Uncharacterized protein n=1 Tax=Pyrus ussuriensis x Pyrus communis TaxID=2448454 RepID=A0A5N5EYI0_9ROSA|nr:hypothetical protein D8674_031235 [Pyrus ussuriensis x Pyrus communis]
MHWRPSSPPLRWIDCGCARRVVQRHRQLDAGLGREQQRFSGVSMVGFWVLADPISGNNRRLGFRQQFLAFLRSKKSRSRESPVRLRSVRG